MANTALSYEDHEAFPTNHAFEIEDFVIMQGDTINFGDTITVIATFKSHLDCLLNFHLNINGGFEYILSNESNIVISDTMRVVQDSIYTIQYTLLANEATRANMEFGLGYVLEDELLKIPPQTHKLYADPHFLQYAQPNPFNDYLARLPVMPHHCTVIPSWRELTSDVSCWNHYYMPLSYSLPAPPVEKNRVIIGGNIHYIDHSEPIYENDNTIKRKGTFQDVWLFFYKKNEGFSNLYHPVPDITQEPIEYVHYARCDEFGNFSFDFEYKRDSLLNSDPTATWDIVLFLAKENEAIELHSIGWYSKIHSILNPYRNNSYLRVYSNGMVPIGQTFNPNAQIFQWNFGSRLLSEVTSGPWFDGNYFRHLTISRKFIQARYDVDEDDEVLPYQRLCSLVNNYRHYAHSLPNCIIFRYSYHNKSAACNSLITTHEYGHEFERHLRNRYTGSLIISEGWAMFFSFAVRAWAHNRFSDRFTDEDNPEFAPFLTFLVEKQSGYFEEEEWDDADAKELVAFYPRFGQMTKLGYPYDGYDMSRFASYLWNIYDSYYDGDFKPNIYQGYDNDDIQGLHLTLFEFFKEWCETEPTGSVESFHDGFLQYISASDELIASIQSIYDFMEFERTVLELSFEKSMNSPQLEFFNPSSVIVAESKSYNFGNILKRWVWYDGVNDVTNFFTVEGNFDNKEDECRHYFKLQEQDDWSYLTSHQANNNQYDIILQPGYHKLSAYNSLADYYSYDGLSYFPFIHHKNSKRVENTTGTSELIVYPNPTKEKLSITFEDKLVVNAVIQVFDGNLKLFSSNNASGNELSSGNITLEVKDLSNGVYHLIVELQMNDGSKRIISRSFVVNR